MININICASCAYFEVDKKQHTGIVYHTCGFFKRHMYMIDETNFANCSTTDPERVCSEGMKDINVNECPNFLEHLVSGPSKGLTSKDLFDVSYRARRRRTK